MTLYFWLLFPLIVYFKGFRNQQNGNKIRVNFTQALIEVNVDLLFEIELSSVEEVRWFIPNQTYQSSQVNLIKNTLIIKVTDIVDHVFGNLSVCQEHNTSESILEIYDIPKCCPCCAWYYKKLCEIFYDKTENCTTITLYSSTNLQNVFEHVVVYENNMFLLPCRMKSHTFKDNLDISNPFSSKQYLNYEDGELKYKDPNFSYNPSVGLCFNTSKLEKITESFVCKYSDRSVKFVLKKLDLKTASIHSSLVFVDEFNNDIRLNDTDIKLLQNTTLTIKCQSQYSFNIQCMMCMQFKITSDTPREFDCTYFQGLMSKDLIINANEIINGSKLVCSIISPSREVSKSMAVTLYKYLEEVLIIKDFDSLNNKVLKVYNEGSMMEVQILFHLIPFNSPITCSSIGNKEFNIKVVCGISVAEQCICKIYPKNIIQLKLKANISISIFNDLFKETISMDLIYIYVEKPKIAGLTAIYEDNKRIDCKVEASRPYNVTWLIKFNKKQRYVHSSTSQYLILPLNGTTHICVQCTVINDAGTKASENECKTILDVEINDNNTVQIFLVNSTIWTGKMERVKERAFMQKKNDTIELLDINSTFVMCASRIKDDKLELLSSLSDITPKNIKEIRTKYTIRIIHELDLRLLASFNKAFRYLCRQRNYTDSTSNIMILRSFVPYIHRHEDHKQKFVIGHNVHLTIDVKSFPPAELKLFKVVKNGLNKSHYKDNLKETKFQITRKVINSTYSKFDIVIFNASVIDSGKYSIIASNFRGDRSFIFTLEEWALPSHNIKLYTTLGSFLVLAVTCLFGVACFCKRLRYAVPIIQIQNNMYKSLDSDLLQIMNTVWPDPRERAKWLINPSSRIKIKERIGGGNYGVVYTGVLQSTESSSSQELVALKCPILSKATNGAKYQDQSQFCQISLNCFINEIKILSSLTKCSNIIKMHGCTTFRDWIKIPTTMIVLEFCSNFSLNEFLNKSAASFAPYTKFRSFTLPIGYTGMKMDEGVTLLDLKRISLGIATGLKYLGESNIIHRDLASRNILIDDGKNPKICDFGLAVELENADSISKSYQILTYNKALPYKILAPEALECQKFYLQSDMWSFGLLMWGIFNLEKEELFPGINTPSELLQHINNRLTSDNRGDFLTIPQYADETTWDLIKTCWSLNPFDRPSVCSIHKKLVDIVRSSPVEVIRVSSCLSEPCDSNCLDSIGSSKFPSACTSLITLNFQTTPIGNGRNLSLETFDERFFNETIL